MMNPQNMSGPFLLHELLNVYCYARDGHNCYALDDIFTPDALAPKAP